MGGAKKSWNHRPSCWKEIAQFYIDNSLDVDRTIAAHPGEFKQASAKAVYLTLQRWSRDVRSGKDVLAQSLGKGTPYGKEVDVQLHDTVRDRLAQGLPMDNAILRSLLVGFLSETGMESLLVENGGIYRFGDSWAYRFYHRWKLPNCRVPAVVGSATYKLE
jgi:hypothetical protein